MDYLSTYQHVKNACNRGHPSPRAIEGVRRSYVKLYASVIEERGRAPVTRHISRTRCLRRAANAQLPDIVVTPALDAAPTQNCASVPGSQGDGDSNDAWREREIRKKEESGESLVCGPVCCS